MTARTRVSLALTAVVTVVIIYGVIVDSALTWPYLVITVAIVAILAGIDRFVRFPEGVLWALAAVAVGNLLGGVLLIHGDTLYLTEIIGSVRYDKFFHAFAAAVGAIAAWSALRRWADVSRITGGLAAVAVLMACGAGAGVEIVEFGISRFYPEADVGDYANNMLDLIANLIGAILGMTLMWLVGNAGGGRRSR